jgi:hypothetical protein
MEYEPPVGSKIRVEWTMDDTTFVWKDKGGGIGRYARAGFVLFWLCLWMLTAIRGVSEITERLSKGDVCFPLLFTFLWMMFGVFGLSDLYHTLRPEKPTVLTLSPGHIEYKPGIPRVRSEVLRYDRSRRRSGFFGRARKESLKVQTTEMTNLRLERIGESKRLSFDYGANRVIIGLSLSDPEKEWLYQILRKRVGTRP